MMSKDRKKNHDYNRGGSGGSGGRANREIKINLKNKSVSKKNLDEVIEKIGKITSSKIINTCYIHFESSLEAKKVCGFLRQQNICSYKGQKIYINYDGSKIIVNGINEENDIKILDIFKCYGKAISANFSRKYFAILEDIERAVFLVENINRIKLNDGIILEINYSNKKNLLNFSSNFYNHEKGETNKLLGDLYKPVRTSIQNNSGSAHLIKNQANNKNKNFNTLLNTNSNSKDLIGALDPIYGKLKTTNEIKSNINQTKQNLYVNSNAKLNPANNIDSSTNKTNHNQLSSINSNNNDLNISNRTQTNSKLNFNKIETDQKQQSSVNSNSNKSNIIDTTKLNTRIYDNRLSPNNHNFKLNETTFSKTLVGSNHEIGYVKPSYNNRGSYKNNDSKNYQYPRWIEKKKQNEYKDSNCIVF